MYLLIRAIKGGMAADAAQVLLTVQYFAVEESLLIQCGSRRLF